MNSGWPNLGDLLSGESSAPIGLVGAPLGAGSVTPGRCDLAPATLRKTLRRIGLFDIESESELSTAIADHGDSAIDGMTIEEATAPIRDAMGESVASHELTLLIGGNNAVTRPGVHGLAQALGLGLDQVGLITLDAHLDMRDLNRGLGNGNPVRALIEDGLPGANIAQVGLAPFANAREMHADALAAGNLLITMGEIQQDGIASAVGRALKHVAHCTALFVDCDIDVIDRSQFPGAPGARPGGMSSADYFTATRLLASQDKVRAIDLTEWDPPLDPTDLSALTAARWVAECIAGFEAR
jgi:arginase family enzyme